MLAIPRDTDPVEAQRLIDEECHNYEQRILRLKMQRNTFTRIAKIPDELLLEIFTILGNTLMAKLWIHLTHVCRHWRWVTVQAPRLWTNPPTYNHNLTLLYLERSVPLGLNVRFGSRASRDTAIAVLINIQRIHTLSFIMVNYNFLTQIQEFLRSLGHEASMLKVLNITPSTPHRSRFKLSLSIFGRLLLLQRLSIQFTDFNWAILPLPSLTFLSLRPTQMSSGLPWETFYRTLAAMPLLKTLYLHFTALQLHTIPSNSTPILLPHLVTLHVADASEADILLFLFTTTMPSLEEVDMTCDAQDHEGYTPIIQAVSSMVEHGNFGTLDELHFYENEFHMYSKSTDSQKHVRYHHPGMLTGPGDAAANVLIDLLSGVSALTSGGNLIVARVTLGMFRPPHTRLIEILASLPLLEAITVRDQMAIPILNNLNIPISAAADVPLAFPSIESIIFEEDIDYQSDEETVFGDEILDMLLDCMMQRCNYNAPISNLSIPWTITRHQFESLKEVVVEVKSGHPGGIQT